LGGRGRKQGNPLVGAPAWLVAEKNTTGPLKLIGNVISEVLQMTGVLTQGKEGQAKLNTPEFFLGRAEKYVKSSILEKKRCAGSRKKKQSFLLLQEEIVGVSDGGKKTGGIGMGNI